MGTKGEEREREEGGEGNREGEGERGSQSCLGNFPIYAKRKYYIFLKSEYKLTESKLFSD